MSDTSALIDLQAERSVLGAILLDPEAFSTIAELRQEDFSDPRNRVVYGAMAECFAAGVPIDYVTVADALDRAGKLEQVDGRGFIRALPEEVPTSTHLKKYAAIVRDRAVARGLYLAGAEIQSMAKERASEDPQVLLEQALTCVLKVGDARGAGRMKRISELIPAVMEKVRGVRGIEGMRTGFSDVDAILGGMLGGQFIVIGARPGMGKTAFGLQMALAVASREQRTVLIASLEMTGEELAMRAGTSEAKVSSHTFRMGYASRQEHERFAVSMDQIGRKPIWIDDRPTQSPVTLRIAVQWLRSLGQLDLVIVDYLQLMRVPGMKERHQEIGAISRSLKHLAKEFRVPVVALAQLNRECEAEKRRPRLSDLRESGEIEQDADVVAFLYREKDAEDKSAEFIVAKQRNGPVGTVKLKFDPEWTRFEGLFEPQDNGHVQ